LKHELLNVIRRLDLDGDRLIDLQEFEEALTPTSIKVNAHGFRNIT